MNAQPYGPNTEAVEARLLEIDQIFRKPPLVDAALDAALDAAFYVALDAARLAALNAARLAARDAARGAARDAALDSASDAASDAALEAAWDAESDAAWDAALDATLAEVVRDLITAEQYATLTKPWNLIVAAACGEEP